ncbi:MAG: phage tail protein [Microscillaceae bacterium]|nr:phage tail protein [Microscillaceae bacterium]
METDVKYPPVGFYFKVVFSGLSDREYHFQEVSGLQMEVEMEEVPEAGNLYPVKMPNKIKYNNLVLKRGMLKDSVLIKWVKDTMDNYFTLNPFLKRDIDIHLLNESGTALVSWQVSNAMPVKWQLSDFKSMDNSIVVETLEFVFEKFKIT